MAELKRIPGVSTKIARTRGALWRLCAARAFWPFLLLIATFLFLTLAGIIDASTEKFASLSLIIFVISLGVLAVLGWARFTSPRHEDAVRLLDRQSDLRPLSMLRDRPSRPDVEGVALWRAHETRLTDAARRLSVPSLAADWKQFDPFYLRYVVPAALAVLLAMTWPVAGDRLKSAFAPDFGSLFGAETIRIEAWITPPAHTGRPPIFLAEAGDDLRVPAGSEITVRAQAPSAPKLVIRSEDDTFKTTFEETPEGAFEAKGIIAADSDIKVMWWGERAIWSVRASPDAPPEVEWVSAPEMSPTDETEFAWTVSDDYGVTLLELVMLRTDGGGDGSDDAVEIQMPSIAPKAAESESAIDLTRHRWAGLEVTAMLRATDGAGQVGLSEPVTFVVPEKLLLQPLARAIQDIRVTILREDGDYTDLASNDEALESGAIYTAATQRITAAPPGVQRASRMIEAVTYEAPRYFEDVSIYFGLRHTDAILQAASSTDEADTTEPLLWSLALRAEYGSAADALRALQAARQALEEALRDGASEAEIQRRLEAFKQAAQNYLAARMAEALANGLEAPADDTDSAQSGGGSGLGGSDFADMLDALSDLTETGATDQARQLLADITNMLENLQFQQGNGSGEGMPGMPGQQGENDEDVPREERELSDTLQELSDLLREQRELNDDTLAEQRGERGNQGQQPGDQNENGEGQSLADRQDGLGDLVDELERRLGEEGSAGGEPGDEDGEGAGGVNPDLLDAIERAQRRAAEGLRDGNTMRAQRNQNEA
ncbi:MAG: DUF4175 family protein, partial [Henriciella sp.]|uniref:DUF4175 family protein n=1 Tax=Henriciella sp. TaxID=1968823 RepID=UPI003C789D6E